VGEKLIEKGVFFMGGQLNRRIETYGPTVTGTGRRFRTRGININPHVDWCSTPGNTENRRKRRGCFPGSGLIAIFLLALR